MFKRKILEKIELFLHTEDILLFYWARQVWKTSLMKYIMENYFKDNSLFFDLENTEYLDLINKWPNLFIEYIKTYHSWLENDKITIFIDEVQYLENPTNFLKYIHDNYKNIKFIVSWSSTFEIRWKLRDSLVWRMIKFDIYPLSFEEFLVFRWKDNLASIIWKEVKFDIINNELRFFYEEYAKFWWYPKVVLSNSVEVKQEYLKQIYDTYIEKDIKDIGKIKEVLKFNKLLKVLANQVWNLMNNSELANTVWVTIKTINEWIFLLENTFVIKIITPFSTNLRWELTKMPKIFFVDNGIKNYIDSNFDLTWNSFENIFFNSITNAYKFEKINFYRTQDKKEIDFILDFESYELKLSYNWKSLTALNYFNEKYNKKGNIITLSKSNSWKYRELYPWEI